jgi:NAD(P)H-nitrite reductase large subunit
MNYVIIGNSTASVGCIEGIRKVDSKGKITVISDEPHHTYGRPLISYMLLGKTDEEHMKYRPDDFYEKNNVTTILGKKVVSIDKDKKELSLDDGKTVEYDKLLVATGSRPFVPPMEGLDKVENKFSFMTLDDAKALGKAINSDSKVLVIGAGLIGLKCVEGIVDKVKSVQVVDLANRILPSILDEKGSALVQRYLEDKKNIEFTLNDSVAQFADNKATLKSGKVIDFDVLVVAVGVRPNVELVSEIGGDVQRGIVVNTKSETSIPDVYSAGDCTVSHNIATDQDQIIAILPNAYLQGETAGMNMAGQEKLFDNAVPMNAIGFFDYHIITAGAYTGEEYVVQEGDNYKCLFTEDNYLKGFIMIGNVKNAGIYTALIRNKTPLSEVDFDLIKDNPQLMAMAKSYRNEKLGGAVQ